MLCSQRAKVFPSQDVKQYATVKLVTVEPLFTNKWVYERNFQIKDIDWLKIHKVCFTNSPCLHAQRPVVLLLTQCSHCPLHAFHIQIRLSIAPKKVTNWCNCDLRSLGMCPWRGWERAVAGEAAALLPASATVLGGLSGRISSRQACRTLAGIFVLGPEWINSTCIHLNWNNCYQTCQKSLQFVSSDSCIFHPMRGIVGYDHTRNMPVILHTYSTVTLYNIQPSYAMKAIPTCFAVCTILMLLLVSHTNLLSQPQLHTSVLGL